MSSTSMKERAIIILPDFPNLPALENVRAAYDPLHGKILPHITLAHIKGSDPFYIAYYRACPISFEIGKTALRKLRA